MPARARSKCAVRRPLSPSAAAARSAARYAPRRPSRSATAMRRSTEARSLIKSGNSEPCLARRRSRLASSAAFRWRTSCATVAFSAVARGLQRLLDLEVRCRLVPSRGNFRLQFGLPNARSVRAGAAARSAGRSGPEWCRTGWLTTAGGFAHPRSSADRRGLRPAVGWSAAGTGLGSSVRLWLARRPIEPVRRSTAATAAARSARASAASRAIRASFTCGCRSSCLVVASCALAASSLFCALSTATAALLSALVDSLRSLLVLAICCLTRARCATSSSAEAMGRERG